MTIQKTCKQHNIFDRMRRVLCDDDSIIWKKPFRNIVIHVNHWRKTKKKLIVEHQNNILMGNSIVYILMI